MVPCSYTCFAASASEDTWRTGSGEGTLGKSPEREFKEGRDLALVNSGSSTPRPAPGREGHSGALTSGGRRGLGLLL